MPLPRPARPDSLRPTADLALTTWALRVRADREQVERLRELDDPSDYYGPVADRFRADPHRTDDQVLAILSAIARPNDTWLDIGAGGGRYALPIALVTREVICVEPSEGMRAVMAGTAEEHGISNIHLFEGRWPPTSWTARGTADGIDADVSLMAHVGYDIEAVGPFLDAMEAVTSRLCVAVMSEGAMTTVATLLWEPIHGEPRVPLPALPELVALLIARGRLPELSLTDRFPPSFESREAIVDTARRQLWLRPGSPKDRRTIDLVDGMATERDGRWALDWRITRIGVVTWEPRDPD
jgi:SAM-dependent methyltransferase